MHEGSKGKLTGGSAQDQIPDYCLRAPSLTMSQTSSSFVSAWHPTARPEDSHPTDISASKHQLINNISLDNSITPSTITVCVCRLLCSSSQNTFRIDCTTDQNPKSAQRTLLKQVTVSCVCYQISWDCWMPFSEEQTKNILLLVL